MQRMKCRFPAAGRTNQRRRVIRDHVQIDVVQRLAFAVPGIQVLDLDSNAHRLCRSKRTAAHDVADRGYCSDNQDNQYK